MTQYYAVAAEGGVPAIGGGPLSARPAAGQPGRVYFSNEGAISRDTGASWSALSGDDAASILEKLLTVDANDSGLNATTLQGLTPGDFAPASHIGDGGTDAHPLATTSEPGFTSRDYTAAEKTKLAGLAEGGGSPDASPTVKGLVEKAVASELQAPTDTGGAGPLYVSPTELAAEITRRLTPEAWITPTLTNGWVNFGTPNETAGYYKDAFGRVHIRGTIKSGTVAAGATGTAFTLPVGYRPAAVLPFLGARQDVSSTDAKIEVFADGSVRVVRSGTSAEVSLNGISFRV